MKVEYLERIAGIKKAFTHALMSKAASVIAKKIDLKTDIQLVSFTFDDAPVSAFTSGGKILETYGYRGTYYVSGGLLGRALAVGQVPEIDIIRDFHGRGHEIGNHTYDHLDCTKAGIFGIMKSVRRNRRMLPGLMSCSFAYPYGAVDIRARVAVRLCMTSARGISFGINRNTIDLTHLKGVRIYDREGMDRCLELVAQCATQGGWLIFYTHDVCKKPSDFGCTPEQLTRLVQAVHDNKLVVRTVGGALDLIENTVWKTSVSEKRGHCGQ
jgi:peptidoglycan/xylan/chitin deacetylase (PgdA/CDA1 family)